MADYSSTVALIFEAINRAQGDLQNIRSQVRGLTSDQQAQTGSTQELSGAQGVLGRVLQEVSSAVQGQAAALGTMGRMAVVAGGATALIVGSLAALGIAAVNAADYIGDYEHGLEMAADQTGLSVEEMAGLTVAAAKVGQSVETVQPGLFIFTRHIAEVAAGVAGAEEKFKSYGIYVRDADGAMKSVSEILAETSERMRTMGDVTERNRMLFELFGRGGIASFKILSQEMGANVKEAQDKGIALSLSQQKVANAAHEASENLKNSFTGLKNQIALSLAGAGTTILDWGAKTIKALRDVHDYIEESAVGAFKDLDAAAKAQEAPPGLDTSKAKVDVGGITVVHSANYEQLNKIVAKAWEQFRALEQLMPLLDYQRSLGAITYQQEIDKLAAMRAQAKSAGELLAINQKIAALIAQRPGVTTRGEKPLGPPAPEWALTPKDVLVGPHGEMSAPLKELKEPGKVGEISQTYLEEYLGKFAAMREEIDGGTAAIMTFTPAMQEMMYGIDQAIGQTQTASEAFGNAIGNTAVGAMNILAETIVGRTKDIGAAFGQLIQSVMAQLLEAIGKRMLGGLLEKIGLGVAAAATGGAALAGGAAGGGTEVGVAFATGAFSRPSAGSSVAAASAAPGARQVHQHFYLDPGSITVQGGIFEPSMMKDWMAEYFGPAMAYAQRFGIMRRGF